MPILVKGEQAGLGAEMAKTVAERNGNSYTIVLCERGLLQSSSSTGKESFLYNFDIKFSFQKAPPELTFEKDEETITYKLSTEKDLQAWRKALKLKLNQRGFHEQFKAMKRIGKGNFASVYLVEKYEDNVRYAVKAFSKEAAYGEEKGKECLVKEIEIMRHLTHKNNMRLHEIFESENSLYIIFELLEGGSLHDKIRAKHKFKTHEIQKIIFGILQGLNEMSDKKIMHRDLKPENLLFRNEGQLDCVIADFGLAEFSDADEYLFVRCGTPGYVAPEVINIKDMKTKYLPICDVFSLGLIFHLLMFGRSAFPGKNYDEVLSQNRASNINLTGEEFLKHGEESLDLLSKMLKKSPKDRVSTQTALKHPFFSMGKEEENKPSPAMNSNPYPNCDSPLYASNNQNRKVLNKKDSCVEFKMGKEAMFNGKLETVNGGINNNTSGVEVNTFESVKAPVSKFSKK